MICLIISTSCVLCLITITIRSTATFTCGSFNGFCDNARTYTYNIYRKKVNGRNDIDSMKVECSCGKFN